MTRTYPDQGREAAVAPLADAVPDGFVGGNAVIATHEIPRSEWRTFFDTFSRTHEGWLATIEVVGNDIGDQMEGIEVPLEASAPT